MRAPHLLVALLPLALMACSDEREITQPSASMSRMVDGTNRFAFDLYATTTPDENLILSPFSIASALSMVLAGANGETEAQILAALSADDEASWHADMGALLLDLSARGGRPYELVPANRVWAQRGLDLVPAFEDTLSGDYDAAPETADFQDDAEGARDEINRWVSRQTGELIPELFGAGQIDANTRLALVNAIYFLGTWETPFEVEDTEDEPFTLTDGEAVTVPIMHRDGDMDYVDTGDAGLLKIPYQGGDLSMVIVLPHEGVALSEVEASLDADSFAGWLASADTRQVELGLPSFELSEDLPLVESLQALGVVDAFSRSAADLTGMVSAADGGDELFVGAAVHKAFIAVDEVGTEAAAATGMVVNAKGGMDETEESVIFQCDRPFLFVLRDEYTDAVLFMGRVVDPR